MLCVSKLICYIICPSLPGKRAKTLKPKKVFGSYHWNVRSMGYLIMCIGMTLLVRRTKTRTQSTFRRMKCTPPPLQNSILLESHAAEEPACRLRVRSFQPRALLVWHTWIFLLAVSTLYAISPTHHDFPNPETENQRTMFDYSGNFIPNRGYILMREISLVAEPTWEDYVRMKSTADEVQEYSNSEREIRMLKERIRKEKLSKGKKCLYEIELDG